MMIISWPKLLSHGLSVELEAEIERLRSVEEQLLGYTKSMEAECDRLRALNAELVEALEGPLLSNSVVYHSPEVLARVRAAIAKARGEK